MDPFTPMQHAWIWLSILAALMQAVRTAAQKALNARASVLAMAREIGQATDHAVGTLYGAMPPYERMHTICVEDEIELWQGLVG